MTTETRTMDGNERVACMTDGTRCVTDKELLERIVVLETAFTERHTATKEALVLAREILAKELSITKIQIAEKLESQNQWQRRWDKNEGLLATKDELAKEIQVLDKTHNIRLDAVLRLVYIGMGIAIAGSYFVGYLKQL